MIAQATGGTISVTGEKGRQPVKPGLSLGDTGTGMTMAITILGALYRRAATGEGHRLQVAMQDAMLHYMRTNFSTQARTGKAVERDGTRSGGGSNAPSGLYPCAPGGAERLCLDHDQPRQSRALVAAVQGDGTRGADQRSALRHAGRAREERCRHWTRSSPSGRARAPSTRRWQQVGGAGIPAGAVFDTMELMNDKNFERTRHHAGDGAPVATSRSRCRPGRCAWTASRRG